MPMIETINLSKRYGDLVALDNLNLSINEGDCFGFIGPNGAGKTTTIKVLATLLKPSSGQAQVAGLTVGYQNRKIRPLIGYVPDFMGAYEDMVVTEYLEFFAAAYGIHGKHRKQVVNDVLTLTDLTYKATAEVNSLSRGMQQRLSVARVLLHDPKVLLMDEPASGLDPRARIEIRELLKELKRMGKTIIISSHILHELAELRGLRVLLKTPPHPLAAPGPGSRVHPVRPRRPLNPRAVQHAARRAGNRRRVARVGGLGVLLQR